MSDHACLYPQASKALAEERARLAPGPAKAFRAFSQSVFADGALSASTKQLIAVAVAHSALALDTIAGHSITATERKHL